MNATCFCHSKFIATMLIIVFGVCGVTTNSFAQDNSQSDWAQFRGTGGTGIAPSSAKPAVEFDVAKQAAWQVAIPGSGWSSPVYESDKVWMTSAVTQAATAQEIAAKLKGDRMAKIKTVASSVELHAICVDVNNGSIVHNIKLDTINSPDPINPMNSYASPTPAIKNGKVICHFGNYGTWCIDEKTGETDWHKQYVVKHSVGPGSSPMIFEDKVILVCDGTDLQYVAALDLKSGDEVWKTDRPPIRATDGEYRKAYCTPLLVEVSGKQQVIVPGAQWVAGYDLNSGSEVWRADYGNGFSVTPMPVFESGMIVISTSYMEARIVGVDPTGKGEIKPAWSTKPKQAPNMPSMIGLDGNIFAVTDNGILRCVDAKTGKLVNEVRVGGNYSASPLLAGGHLYLSSREGKMIVVQCDKEMETVATNQFESSIMASPVLVGNDLLVRTEKKLIRIKASTPNP
jgi:outer membrane protein assembly factor BamB